MSYTEEFNKQGIRYFAASEFLVKGNSNASGKCQGENTDPPEDLWENSFKCAKVWDEIRDRLGKPLVVTSHYRSPEYNACIGGASQSRHKESDAADVYSPHATPKDIYMEAMKLRNEGFFSGGIGLYTGFVHVDTRGENANWQG